MPEQIQQLAWMWDRAGWVAARDNKGMKGGAVPKGAAKVSLGDAIEKFHKAAAKGVREGYKSGADLQKTLDAYKKAVAVKYPQILDPIKKKLENHLKGYMDNAKKIVEYLGQYSKNHAAATQQLFIAGLEYQKWEKAGSQGKFKPSNAKKLTDAVKLFLTSVQSALFTSDKFTRAEMKALDAHVLKADGDDWSKSTVHGLIDKIKVFPPSV